MDFFELKDFLDFKAEQYENIHFLQEDPIQIPHLFSKKEDIEISAFLVATIAWGNRKSILKSSEKLMHIMDHSPYEFIMNYKSSYLSESKFVHRTFNATDLDFFFRSLQHFYQHGGLEKYFSSLQDENTIKSKIITFRKQFLSIAHSERSTKHISNPDANSAAKRLNMFLRWMVRSPKKEVDFGLWKNINTCELCIPLDVHTGNIARKLNILTRKQDDWKSLEELMSTLRKMDPVDPVKYDFALFGLGAFEKF